ncbi:MAG TPA: triose-phosphate isomerase [Candidatus Avalokitesvara rifleensis]|uniref:triose-phosphate isomerase n=1 Tax=Candidatus Avalokitesvara rifleensis TaxID=3367620 RepID=UPI0027134E87|nr:triose-phosphate isomerase [Candidatus Brocadiales bacterium]
MLRPFIAGNWKMNLTLKESKDLAGSIRADIEGMQGVDVGAFPPSVFLESVYSVLKGSSIILGAQNMHWEDNGAFTGEVSGSMIKDVGCTHVILGHSERRHIFGETDSMINLKLRAAFARGIMPIFCLGERLEERESGKTFKVIEKQLKTGLEGLKPDDVSMLTIAYEPVWAIGTGKNATPAQAQEVHGHIRALLEESHGEEVSPRVRIQYGGSVKPDNAAEILAQPDINGLLIGGASLKKDSFCKIVSVAFEQVRSPV